MIYSRVRGLLPRDREVWLFLLYSAALHIGYFGVADVVLNFYFVSLGHDSATIGVLQSQPRLAGLLTSIPIGLLANRTGVHRMLIISTVGIVVSMLLEIVFPSLAMLVIAQFLVGVFYGGQQIAVAPMMVTLVPPERRTRFFAVHNVIAMATMAAGSFIGGYLPAIVVSATGRGVPAVDPAAAQTPFAYGSTIVIGAILILIGLIPFWFVRSGRKPRKVAHVAEPPRVPVPWRKLTVMTLPMLGFGFTGGLTFPFYNLFFRTQFGVPDDGVGTILSIGWFGMALIPMFNPWWERRYGRAWSLGILLSLAAVAFQIMAVASTLALCVIAFVFAISFRNCMQPLFQPLTLDHLPSELHNNVSSMSMVMWNVGWYVATLISGWLQQTYGFDVVYTIVAVGVFATGASVVAIFHRRRPYAFESA